MDLLAVGHTTYLLTLLAISVHIFDFLKSIHLFYDLIKFLSIYYSNHWKFIILKMSSWDGWIHIDMGCSRDHAKEVYPSELLKLGTLGT